MQTISKLFLSQTFTIDLVGITRYPDEQSFMF